MSISDNGWPVSNNSNQTQINTMKIETVLFKEIPPMDTYAEYYITNFSKPG